MKLLRVIGFLFGAAFLLVAGNHFFNPQYEADSTLILLLLLPVFFMYGIEHHQAGRKKTAIFSFTIISLSLLFLISSLFIAWP
ncbi:hypothetical protein [Planococcus beigongshangi]|uniref:hypothetical protein n=1 Tax=Planococcus beigongshangi TaxID=2782536 RepID=UPI00193BEBF4|nr:hypothetical protein [Planococcus beigongshangi]